MSDMIGHNSQSPQAVRESLSEKHADKISRKDELLAAVARVPEITNDETAGKAGDFVKQIMSCRKDLEGIRVMEKRPYDDLGDAVQALFKPAIDDLDKAKKQVEAKQTVYLRAKEQAERAERERVEAEARETARKAADLARAAEEAAKDATGMDDAIAAAETAKQAAADAAQAEKAAEAKAAELSRSRGEYGSVSSLRTVWSFKDLDRSTVDLEVLRAYLTTEAIEQALRGFIRAGGRQIKGAEIFENKTAVVR